MPGVEVSQSWHRRGTAPLDALAQMVVWSGLDSVGCLYLAAIKADIAEDTMKMLRQGCLELFQISVLLWSIWHFS